MEPTQCAPRTCRCGGSYHPLGYRRLEFWDGGVMNVVVFVCGTCSEIRQEQAAFQGNVPERGEDESLVDYLRRVL